MMGVSDFWQMVIKGVVIVTAVVIDQFQQRLQSKVILLRRHEKSSRSRHGLISVMDNRGAA